MDAQISHRFATPAYRQCGADVAIRVDGQAIAAIEGDTIAAAMAASGLRQFGVDRGRIRAGFCGMGVCMDCIVTVDGRPGQRACLTKVQPGQEIHTKGGAAAGRPGKPLREERCDVAIVGAGPAGLAAAAMLARRGLDVAVLDERPSPGGQYFKPLSPGFVPRKGAAADAQFAAGQALVAEARAAGARFHTGCMVWDITRQAQGYHLFAESEANALHWSARFVILATGAAERPLPVPGWTLPGVMATGAAQTLSRSYRVAPGRRILIAGNGPLNLQLAASLAADGAELVAVAEAAPAPWAAAAADLVALARHGTAQTLRGLGYLGQLWARRVPLHFSTALLRVHGAHQVEAATLAIVDAEGRPLPGSEWTCAVDTVCMGYGFQPNLELQQILGLGMALDQRQHARGVVPDCDAMGRSSLPGLYVAGDCAGIWGADAAQSGGRLAAEALLADREAGKARPDAAARQWQQDQAGQRAFQGALWRIYRAPPLAHLPDDDAILCRCEAVPRAEVFAAQFDAAALLADMKRATRCGMGRCQGRLCSANLAACHPEAMQADSRLPAQVPAKPITLDAMAGYAALIGDGTSVAPLPAPPPSVGQPLPAPLHADVAVIGGGAIGLCTALALQESGASVVVIDRDRGRGQASFANAGSLHTQILAYAFPILEGENVQAALDLLRLQKRSVALWQALAPRLDTNIEIAVTGGLVVAETPEDLEKLRRKVVLENAAGADSRLLTAAEAQGFVPHLSSSVMAASYAADEGKINPLLAAPALARLARRNGITILEQAPVQGIRREPEGFAIATARGLVRARRVVNAAGGWAGEIAGMIGETIPVRATPLHMLVSEPAPPLTDLLLAHVSERLTMKQAKAGNMIIGGGWRAVAAADGRLRASAPRLAGNLVTAARVLPPVADLVMLRSWVAVNSGTDGRPILRESGRERGFFHAVTMNGMTLGPAYGRACADLVLGRQADPLRA